MYTLNTLRIFSSLPFSLFVLSMVTALGAPVYAHHHPQHHVTCVNVTPQAITTLNAMLQSARHHAQRDAEDHGQDNAYPRKHLNAVVKANDVISELVSELNDHHPDVTHYAEAGLVIMKTDEVRHLFVNAQWWATLSSVYNDRTEGSRSSAYQSLRILEEAMEYVNRLNAKARTCYMAAYLQL